MGRFTSTGKQLAHSEKGHALQNHYTHEIVIFKLFRGLQLQFSGVLRIN